MAETRKSRISEVLSRYEKEIIEDWIREQISAITLRKDLLPEADLRRESTEFLALFLTGCRGSEFTDITIPQWAPVREYLAGISRSRAAKGFTPSETATFIFSLKQPVFSRLLKELGADAELWESTVLLDKLGLYTTEMVQKSQADMIRRQQSEMLELSTPVVKIWDGILVLPLIGTLDSERTQVVMESLLQSIIDTGSAIAIIDITGVPTVDTLVAQHLLKTVSATKLMGAQCVISGIRPQIAQTMVHLGVAFGDVVTKSSLADALAFAFRQSGIVITRNPARS